MGNHHKSDKTKRIAKYKRQFDRTARNKARRKKHIRRMKELYPQKRKRRGLK